MSSDPILLLTDVWKKYKIQKKSGNTLREDIEKIFSRQKKKDLTTGEFWALKNINIKVDKGEAIGIYGPNGSGKTTIIKLISRVTSPTRGEIKVNGTIAPLISVGAGFHPELTGRENIYTNGTILGMSVKHLREREKEIIEFSGLGSEFLDMPIKKYSSGMNARLGFSVAVHSNADIFLLDEILAVGDEAFRAKCSEKIKALMRQDKTFLIISHNHEQLKSLSSRIYYLREGQITDIQSTN